MHVTVWIIPVAIAMSLKFSSIDENLYFMNSEVIIIKNIPPPKIAILLP